MKSACLAFAAALLVSATALADPLAITLVPDGANPPSPQMGDRLLFHSTIRNTGTAPIDGMVGWISLVQVDRGREQPMDLEDWSAHKAITLAELPPGQAVKTDWPMRLIQAGHYRVVVSAATRTGATLVASPFTDFVVRQKPVVESQRVLPVAFGIPLLLGIAMLWRGRRR